MPIIELKTEIKANIEVVFNLSRSVDLHKISTAQTNEQAISGKTSGLIGLNQWVTWRAKHFGFYQELTSKITEFEFPNYFIDEMQDGIFKRFKHLHKFEQMDSIVQMIDVFDYDAPLGKLGQLADKLFLKKYMTDLLEKRNATIKEYAESERWENIIH